MGWFLARIAVSFQTPYRGKSFVSGLAPHAGNRRLVDGPGAERFLSNAVAIGEARKS